MEEYKNFIKRDNFSNYDDCLRNKSDYEICLQEYVNFLSKTIYDEEQLTKKTPSSNSKKNTSSSKPWSNYIKIHNTPTQGISLLITKKRSLILKKIIDKFTSNEIIIHYHSNFDNTEKQMSFDTNIEIHQHISKNMIITSYTLNQLINQISNNEIHFSSILSSIYQNIVNKFETLEADFYKIINFITDIDVLYGKVKMITQFHLSKPIIKSLEKDENQSYINIKGLRHLIIEQMNNDELYISNDINIHYDKDNSPSGILLFGTNAVGKTSFIKSLGICVIMAQAGLYVPCNFMEFYPYEYIFTRILGNDNIFKGLSTFAVEMSELRIILNKSNQNSLILGDELCSGTEIESATSIFVSSLQNLYHKNTSFIFATHFHEIVKYDEIKTMDKIHCKHMKVKFNKELDSLVYDRKICEGSGDAIYGLEVCKSLRMPDDFLNKAYEIRNKYSGLRDKNILNMKICKYNNNKIKGMCEFCNEKMGSEIHHLQYQHKASKYDDYIDEQNNSFHKNHKANLMSICEECHHFLHKKNMVLIRQKVGNDYVLMPQLNTT